MPLTPFADGPGNTASGVAVYNNDLYLEALANAKEAAFSTYRQLQSFATMEFALGAAGTYISPCSHSGSVAATSPTLVGSSVTAFYLDPTDYLAGTRTTKYRIRAQLITNVVAPAANFTVGLYPATAFSGAASGQKPIISSIGAVTSGSTVAFTAPPAGAALAQTSGDFNAPAANFYVIGFALSAVMAAGSTFTLMGDLQMRQV